MIERCIFYKNWELNRFQFKFKTSLILISTKEKWLRILTISSIGNIPFEILNSTRIIPGWQARSTFEGLSLGKKQNSKYVKRSVRRPSAFWPRRLQVLRRHQARLWGDFAKRLFYVLCNRPNEIGTDFGHRAYLVMRDFKWFNSNRCWTLECIRTAK